MGIYKREMEKLREKEIYSKNKIVQEELEDYEKLYRQATEEEYHTYDVRISNLHPRIKRISLDYL